MNRADLKTLTALRVAEAKALLVAGQYAGSRYLMGYAVEFALKSIVAQGYKKHDFPPPRKVVDELYTHDLNKLIGLAGLQAAFQSARNANATLENHWGTVKVWTEQWRYSSSPVTAVQAQDFHDACLKRTTGVLTWIKARW